MIYTMLKFTFDKVEPIELTYRDYKNFSFDRLKVNLENAFKSYQNHTIVLKVFFVQTKCICAKKNEVGKRE